MDEALSDPSNEPGTLKNHVQGQHGFMLAEPKTYASVAAEALTSPSSLHSKYADPVSIAEELLLESRAEVQKLMREALALRDSNAPEEIRQAFHQRIHDATTRAELYNRAWEVCPNQHTDNKRKTQVKQAVNFARNDISLFQLHNNVRDRSREVFASVSDFLETLEAVVKLKGGDIGATWQDIMPAALSSERSWFTDNILAKGLNWTAAENEFKRKYGGATHAAVITDELHEMKT